MEIAKFIFEIIGLGAVATFSFLFLRDLARRWFPKRDKRMKDWEDRHGY